MSKEKKKYIKYNEAFLNILEKEFHCDHNYLRKFLRGDRPSIKQDEVQARYKQLVDAENLMIKQVSKRK